VTKDANIVVTFSEPMNQAATQAAYQSVDLPAGDVTFGWDASGTQLTVNPNTDLTYLATTDSAAAPKMYSFSLTNTATDLAGNKLANKSSSFSTLKQVTNILTVADTKTLTSDGRVFFGPGVNMAVGDDSSNTTYRSFVSFDIGSLPATLTGARILDANLKYEVVSVNFSPFEDLATCSGGAAGICTHLIIESVNYGPALEATDFEVAPLREVRAYRQRVVQEPTVGDNTVNVLTSVQDDQDNRATRGGRSQFRYRFSKLTDADKTPDALLIKGGLSSSPSLEVVYLFP
jgi:hypothetical protein